MNDKCLHEITAEEKKVQVKVGAFIGSPRKEGNTAILIKNVLGNWNPIAEFYHKGIKVFS